MIAIGSLLPRASVDLLLTLMSLDSLPGLSSTALGVLCSVGALLGDRCLVVHFHFVPRHVPISEYWWLMLFGV